MIVYGYGYERPRLRFKEGVWSCVSSEAIGEGLTLWNAYLDWFAMRRMLEFALSHSAMKCDG